MKLNPEYVKVIFSKDNITLFIAILGAVLSLWNFFKEFWTNRSKVCLLFKKAVFVHDSISSIRIEMVVENHSRLPISISRAFLVVDKQKLEFNSEPRYVFRSSIRQNKDVIDTKVVYSVSLPNTIPALGVLGPHFFVFNDFKLTRASLLNSKIKIILYTNRGKKNFKIVPSFENVVD